MRDVTVNQGPNSQSIVAHVQGNVTLSQLNRDELVEEAAYSLNMAKTRRQKRYKAAGVLAGIAAICALLAIGIAYWMLLRNHSLTPADIFNGLAPSAIPALAATGIPTLGALWTGAAAYGKFIHPGSDERFNQQHARAAHEVAKAKNLDENWKTDVRKCRRRSGPQR